MPRSNSDKSGSGAGTKFASEPRWETSRSVFGVQEGDIKTGRNYGWLAGVLRAFFYDRETGAFGSGPGLASKTIKVRPTIS